MAFKKFDLWAQIVIFGVTLCVPVILRDAISSLIFGSLIFYGGMGSWQLVSFIVNLLQSRSLPGLRLTYAILLPLALMVCLMPLLKGISDRVILVAMPVGFVMAVFYFIITVREYRAMRRTENHLGAEE